MKLKEKNDVIVLNNDTKIIYNHKYNNELTETKFTINNKNNQIIIKFCKTDIEYNIFVYFMEKDNFRKNKLFISNDSYDDISTLYKYLNLELPDGSEKEIEKNIDSNEEDILDEIFFIIYEGKYFQEKNILRSFNIITPLLKDLIQDFTKFRSKNIMWNNKKLVKNN